MTCKRKQLALAVASVFLTFGVTSIVEGQQTGARLGKVSFETSCNATAQKDIDLAMAYFHSFDWGRYKAPLDNALKADPACGMAHWVRALGTLDNPFAWPVNLNAKVLGEGEAALEAARKAGLKTQRERDYVEALAEFYRDHDKLAHPERAKRLEAAFGKLAERYPQDVEATILHALFLSRNFDPQDKSYGNQLRAAQILEPIFMKQPEHPGVAHYLIHSYDYPALARQGLEAAKRYSGIAPDAAHALHMPSHIFTRVGHWKESVASNRASAEAAKGSTPNRLHALDYMTYAHLQMGQDEAARAVFAESRKVEKPADNFAAAYGLAAIPARLALERAEWSEAAKLELHPARDAFPWGKYPQAEAINAYARAIGAARTKDVAAARSEHERLLVLRDQAKALKFGYWADQIDIQAEAVAGLVALAEGQAGKGIELLRNAAKREDATEKHVVTPGPLVPARELLGNALLDQGDAVAAMKEFEAVLVREPNRYRPMLGAAMAADKAGDKSKAREHYSRLLEVAEGADSGRVELASARKAVGR
jgi:Tfp pilus assembly protein PilF